MSMSICKETFSCCLNGNRRLTGHAEELQKVTEGLCYQHLARSPGLGGRTPYLADIIITGRKE
jgi:hypothetical protein